MINFIIPTYNSENTIKRCLSSILKLKATNYKIIIVDDGSKDNTLKILKHYKAKYPHINIFLNNHHGTSFERNFGLKQITNGWVCFIDSDDYINANKLNAIIKKYCISKNDLIITNLNINNNIIKIGETHNYTVKDFINKYYPIYGKEDIQTIGCKVYNYRAIKKYNIKFPSFQGMGEDFIFNLNFILSIKEHIQCVDDSYYYYKLTYKSTTNQFEYNVLNHRMLILKYLNNIFNKYNINTQIMDQLKIKALYSALLNIFKTNTQKVNNRKYIYNEVEEAKSNNLIPKSYKNCNFEYKILLTIIKINNISFLYLFLAFINIIRAIKFKFFPF